MDAVRGCVAHRCLELLLDGLELPDARDAAVWQIIYDQQEIDVGIRALRVTRDGTENSETHEVVTVVRMACRQDVTQQGFKLFSKHGGRILQIGTSSRNSRLAPFSGPCSPVFVAAPSFPGTEGRMCGVRRRIKTGNGMKTLTKRL